MFGEESLEVRCLMDDKLQQRRLSVFAGGEGCAWPCIVVPFACACVSVEIQCVCSYLLSDVPSLSFPLLWVRMRQSLAFFPVRVRCVLPQLVSPGYAIPSACVCV